LEVYSDVDEVRRIHHCESDEEDPSEGKGCIKSVKIRFPFWKGGDKEKISWNNELGKKGCTGGGDRVTLSLYTLQGCLTDILSFDIENTGSATVQVPRGLTPGIYKVLVKSSSLSRQGSRAWSEPIQIEKGDISDVRLSTSSLIGGGREEITWRTEGNVPKISVSLYTSAQCFKLYLEHEVENRNSCSVDIPFGLTPGIYLIRVESFTNKEVRA